jgi:hypothetical protein
MQGRSTVGFKHGPCTKHKWMEIDGLWFCTRCGDPDLRLVEDDTHESQTEGAAEGESV